MISDSLTEGVESEAAADLALLSECTGGTVASHGTFGTWGALLAAHNSRKQDQEGGGRT